MKDLFIRGAVLALCVIVLSQSVKAQVAGQLDRTFANNGLLKIQIGTDQALGGLVVQPDRKIVVAGGLRQAGSNRRFFLARYNVDGSPDPTFGTNGLVTTSFGSLNARVTDLVRLSDGRFVAVGVAAYDANETNNDIVAARYNANGSLDTTFGNGGLVIVNAYDGAPPCCISEFVSRIAVHPTNGSIVGVGQTVVNGSRAILLVFFDTNGAASFVKSNLSRDGVNFGSFAFGLAFVGNDKIIVGGRLFTEAVVAQYTLNGMLDQSFGINGFVQLDFGRLYSTIQEIAVLPDGKLLIVGNRSDLGIDETTIVRLNVNGSFDTTFGNGGKVLPAFGNALTSLITDYNGKFYVGCFDGCTSARYNANGTLDPTFGNGGVAPTIESLQSGVFSALQNDGKIVVAGLVSNNEYLGVARYRSSPLYKKRWGL